MTDFEIELQAEFGPGDLAVDNTRFLFVNAGIDGWDTPDITIVVRVLNWATSAESRVWLHLDPVDGHTIGHTRPPATLEPWSKDQIYHPDGPFQFQNAFLLGDVDRDGFVEYGVTTTAVESYGWNTSNSYFAIVGRETLSVPDQVNLGATIPLAVHLPNAAGMSVAVIASDRFLRKEGLAIGGWNTHLGDGAVLQRSLLNPVTGVLDAQGKASLSARLPNRALLSGRTLWLRGLVHDPLQPGHLFTMTTLASVEIL